MVQLTAGEQLQNDLGRRIRSLREARGLTREALAEQIEMSPQNVVKVEAGDRFLSAGSLALVATVLAVPVSELFKFAADVPARAAAIERLETLLSAAPERVILMIADVTARVLQEL